MVCTSLMARGSNQGTSGGTPRRDPPYMTHVILTYPPSCLSSCYMACRSYQGAFLALPPSRADLQPMSSGARGREELKNLGPKAAPDDLHCCSMRWEQSPKAESTSDEPRPPISTTITTVPFYIKHNNSSSLDRRPEVVVAC